MKPSQQAESSFHPAAAGTGASALHSDAPQGSRLVAEPDPKAAQVRRSQSPGAGQHLAEQTQAVLRRQACQEYSLLAGIIQKSILAHKGLPQPQRGLGHCHPVASLQTCLLPTHRLPCQAAEQSWAAEVSAACARGLIRKPVSSPLSGSLRPHPEDCPAKHRAAQHLQHPEVQVEALVLAACAAAAQEHACSFRCTCSMQQY